MDANVKGGLSWIELLFLLGVFVILASVLIPTVPRCYREPARRAEDASKIRQIGQAALIYANDNDNRLPGLTLTQTGEIDPESVTPNIHAIAAALARVRLGGVSPQITN